MGHRVFSLLWSQIKRTFDNIMMTSLPVISTSKFSRIQQSTGHDFQHYIFWPNLLRYLHAIHLRIIRPISQFMLCILAQLLTIVFWTRLSGFLNALISTMFSKVSRSEFVSSFLRWDSEQLPKMGRQIQIGLRVQKLCSVAFVIHSSFSRTFPTRNR